MSSTTRAQSSSRPVRAPVGEQAPMSAPVIIATGLRWTYHSERWCQHESDA
jgi:hypothetical protein